MANIAILGFGTVGGGVPEVLAANGEKIRRRLGQPLQVKYILDTRTLPPRQDGARFVKDIDVILRDADVQAVVETIGGLNPAHDYVRRALQSGKHVVTSNKELVAAHGAELLALARQKGVCFLFEASVGGGMPLITPIHQCLASARIDGFMGIVNGTTNFMLTMMEKQGLSFEAALEKAQVLGYAETGDPSADVDGHDAARKTAILASLCFGAHIYPQDIATRGIRELTTGDMAAAKQLGGAVKLLAWARREEGLISCGVEPVMLSRENPLAAVSDVNNAVQLDTDTLGRVQFYGPGAGRLPTANAVVTDCVDAVKLGASIHDSLFWQAAAPVGEAYPDTGVYSFYLRAEGGQAALRSCFADAQPVGENAVLTLPLKAEECHAALREFAAGGQQVTGLKWLD